MKGREQKLAEGKESIKGQRVLESGFKPSTYWPQSLGYLYFNIGLSMLSAISAECCLSVLWPIWYHCHCPRHTLAVMCAILWVLSLLVSTLEGYQCHHLFNDFDYFWCQDSPEEDECGDSLSQEALEMSGSRGVGDKDQTDWL
ncbi:mas-related G-protein coupled receptor member X2-like [Ictidomys tridecemlineatus]|uniref:mas-related G-protein coupled receptor member X2-like n=1 Tax=Ictidomys tridecemlineatus TaxID=43179 RepID=UPI000B548ACF|nr:mas-related G-protein coupled receptor member X2-like [Ictidomys tridecemlineatus]KAG3285609.1 mas-related G-protein coupled receptor member X2-like [Ictidomys tridecemlineatus]